MGKPKIFIVEDEIMISESMTVMLEDLGYEVLGTSITAEDGFDQILRMHPDFALLDISLRGEKDGIWLGERIKETIGIPFMFLTSFGDKETIVQAMNTSPYGYLVKPVEKQNLFAGIEVALKKFSEEIDEANSEETSMAMEDFLFVKDEYLFKKISVDDVLFVKADGNYIEVFVEAKKHIIRGSLKTFKESLPKFFFQMHRSYIVNMRKIENFGSKTLMVKNHEIPIAKGQKKEFQKAVKTYSSLNEE